MRDSPNSIPSKQRELPELFRHTLDARRSPSQRLSQLSNLGLLGRGKL